MRAILLDLDGTVYTDAGTIPGAADAIRALRSRGMPIRFLTNTTRRSRAALAARLRGFDIEVSPDELLTPARAAMSLCDERGFRRVAPFLPYASLEDFAGLDLFGSMVGSGRRRPEVPDAIVLGDLGEHWSFPLLQEAFDFVMAGAEMIALSRDRYWMHAGKLTLDAGPFVAALEHATGRTATVTGKPNATFFQAAVKSLEAEPDEVIMVGDDLFSDVQGAQNAGYRGWLVRTGKFREQELRESSIVPDRVIESIADLPALMSD
jgi:HAD superfamily hydrolase (TIGR01458 family)